MDQGRPVPRGGGPTVKVVGFHVEGVESSPRPDALRAATGSSPSPVIIPPTAFQGQRESSRGPELPSRRSMDCTPAGAPSAGQLPPVQAPSAASRRDEAAAEGRTPKAAPSPKHPPGTPSSSAPANMSNLQAAASPPPASKSSAATPQPASGAPGKGPQPASQRQSSSSSSSSSRPQQKEMSKAERRALQEAQRAAKAAASAAPDSGAGGKLTKTASGGSLSRQTTSGSEARQGPTPQPSEGVAKGSRQRVAPRAEASTSSAAAAAAAPAVPAGGKPTELFSHLQQFKKVSVQSVAERSVAAAVPMECVRLGLQMADGSIRGANTRCAAMLEMFCSAIREFKTPPGRSFAREFSSAFNSMVSFLVGCRPLSPAMGNVVKHVKAALERLKLNAAQSDGEAQRELLADVGTFLQEKVRFARDVLARNAAAMVQDGDVVLTYAYSTTVEAVLLAAHDAGVRFSAVVVDSRPLLEGRRMLRRLLAAAIPCEYVYINGIDIGLSRATRVVLGAGAVLSNGAVMARVGTAAVAMAAAAAHVPVLVCAETYKFHERVQLDSITHNELGDPEALVLAAEGEAGGAALAEWAPHDNLSLLNLMYDATPAEFVSVVVTEVGVLPPTSVPVVLREYRREMSVS